MDERSPRRRAPLDVPAHLSRRRFRTLNLTTTLPLLVAVGAVLVARQAQTWPQALWLLAGVAAVVVAFERWTVGAVSRVAVPCLTIGAVVWPVGAFTMRDAGAQGGFYALTVVGPLVVSQLTRRRALAAVCLVGYVAGVGALAVLLGGDRGLEPWLVLVIVPTAVAATVTGLMFPNSGFYDVVAELEEAKDREAELAVARERVRFAGDLHDIQGHTLHVVKLKVALAQRLLEREDAAARGQATQELEEVHTLVSDTIAQAKELAFGQRRLNLSAELVNAQNLFEAAGIHVRVERRGEVDPAHVELLGQVLRETTTNILRHAQAAVVRITLAEHSITVLNDGVRAGAERPVLRGLAALADRVAEAGGRLSVDVVGGRFRTAADFAPEGSA